MVEASLASTTECTAVDTSLTATAPGDLAAAGSKQLVTRKRRVQRVALLMRSYREEFWYWESLELLRKYLLTSVVLVAWHDSLLQVYLGLLVCVASALLVSRCQPYKDDWCGQVQLLALTQLTFTYMSGMLFFDDGAGTAPLGAEATARWGVILIAVNILTFLLLGVGLVAAVGGSVQGARDELAAQKLKEAALHRQLQAMREVPRLAIEPPPPTSSAARLC